MRRMAPANPKATSVKQVFERTIMAAHADISRTPFVYRLPVIGGIAREWAEGHPDFPFMLVLAFVSAWACAALIWGLPALVITAVGLVPLLFVLLVLITRG
jgi:hypothetical protein